MVSADILSQLTPIFRDVFDDDSIVPIKEMVAADVESWDSLGHIRLIVAVEMHFKIKFTSAEINSWPNVGSFVETIALKLRDKNGQY